MTTHERLTWDEAIQLAERALGTLGYAAGQAGTIARHLVSAEAGGQSALGLTRVMWIQEILDGGAPRGDPSVVTHGEPAITVVEGHGGVGYLAAERALARARSAALESGVAVAAVRNVFLTGALRTYCGDLASAGLLSIIVSSAAPALLAPGIGGRRALGTNPLAIGVPGHPFPVVFDSSSSEVSYSEVVARARRGEPLPEGAGLDANGAPTRDATSVVDGGALLGWAGHRGFGLATVVQAVAMTLGVPPAPRVLSDCGMLAVVVHPGHWGASSDGIEVGALLEVIGAASASEQPRVPGQHWAAAQARAREGGLELDNHLVNALRRLADSTNPSSHGAGPP
jgi:LDH2 family malate/lactate/ureidoglycolate dehydrogenase